MPKTYTCKSCGSKFEKIGVTSVCRQAFHIGSDDYTDTNVEETINGFCLQCGHMIPAKDLKRLTGLTSEGVFVSHKAWDVISAAEAYTKENGASGTDCDLKNAVQAYRRK